MSLMAHVGNLFAEVQRQLPVEQVTALLGRGELRIERIVSQGHVSPEGFWFDQEEDEWVLVVQGEAKLRLEGVAELVAMKAGDYLNIPSHQRHRVEWTKPGEATIWLAVFYRGEGSAGQPGKERAR